MTFLTLYHQGGEPAPPSTPILAGADLSSDLSCGDDPGLAVFGSALACGDDTGVSVSSTLVCTSGANLPGLTSLQVCVDENVTLSSGLVCGDAVDSLTISSANACGALPEFFQDEAPAATYRQGRFFLL